ncbi:MAG: tellurite resistance TerB family protein [Oceanicola sp.]|nr:tellurite resistance TerB family protein [Oceanicola sp.]
MSPQDALIAVMIAVSVSDSNIRTTELVTIQRIVNHLPIFANYDQDRMQSVSAMVFELFEDEDGVEAFLGLIRQTLPQKLSETAYALACDVAAADGRLQQVELRLLQALRHELAVDRLHGAAIERGARARHTVL